MKRLLSVLALMCLLTSVVAAKEPNKSDPKNWKVGMNLQVTASEEAIKEFSEAGFNCCEVRSTVDASKTDKQLIEEFKAFKAACDKYGVEIWSLHMRYGDRVDISSLDPKIQEETRKDALRFFKLNKYLGAKVFVVHSSWLANAGEDREARINQAVETYNFLRKEAAKKGILLATENLPGKWAFIFTNSTTWLDFMKRIGPDGLWCFDCGHALEETPDHFVEQMDRVMTTVHMHDNDRDTDSHWLPYEGGIDWHKLMNALIEKGYQGPFIFEFESTVVERREFFEKVAKVWDKLQNDHD